MLYDTLSTAEITAKEAEAVLTYLKHYMYVCMYIYIYIHIGYIYIDVVDGRVDIVDDI